MEQHSLGSSTLVVPPVVVGTMSRRRDRDGERERVAVFQAALAAGLTTFDTAPLYAYGAADEFLGKALRGRRRDEFQVLSKVGLRWDSSHGRVLYEYQAEDGTRRQVRRDARPESVRRDVEGSLRRLGLDHLELVQVHHPDLDTPIAETMGALLDLRREGKLAEIGVSNFSVAQTEAARAALGSVPLASVQSEFSLLRRDLARDVLPWVLSKEVGFLAYSPLAQGVLAGKRVDGDTKPPLAQLRAEIAATLGPIARAHAVGTGEVALAWTLAQPGISAVIGGASAPAQVAALASAATLRLHSDELALISRAFEALSWPHEWRAPRSLRTRVRERARRAASSAARTLRALDPRLAELFDGLRGRRRD